MKRVKRVVPKKPPEKETDFPKEEGETNE